MPPERPNRHPLLGEGIKGEGELATPKGSIAIHYQPSAINLVAVFRRIPPFSSAIAPVRAVC